MLVRRLCSAAVVMAFCLAGAHGAAPDEKSPYDAYQAKELSFSALKMGLATRVNDIRADGVNRVWFAAGTTGGVAAIDAGVLAPFFPLTSRDGLLAPAVAAVAFGPLSGQENFFLGFNDSLGKGIQYGRMLSDTGLSPKPLPSLLSTISDAENFVLELASDGSENLWAATQAGLVWWKIGGAAPERHAKETLQSGHAINHAAIDPWVTNSHMVFSDRDDAKLYVLPNGATSEQSFHDMANVVGFAFDGNRNLWVAAGTRGNSHLYRFSEGDLANPFAAPPDDFLFDSEREIHGLAIDPLVPDGPIVWVGTDSGAYFRKFDETAGVFVGTEWTQANTGFGEADVRVYVDPSGNVWFGSDFGVRALLSRLLTLSSSRFVGYGAKATVKLLDVNPDTDPPVVYVVKAGGAVTAPELTLTTTKKSDGTYSASFGFASATVEGKSLGVASAATDAAFEVVYQFGPEGSKRELPRARFTWANVVPFDDDVWVGNACFVKSLGLPCAGR